MADGILGLEWLCACVGVMRKGKRKKEDSRLRGDFFLQFISSVWEIKRSPLMSDQSTLISNAGQG